MAEVKSYFRTVLHDRFKKGKDLYTPMFIVELLCIGFLLFFGNRFSGLDASFVEFMLSNYVPFSFVILLFIQFIFMLLDRIIYLTKSVRAKVLLQYASVITFGVMFFIYFPVINNERTSKIPSLIVFYLLKCVYWVISGYQIRFGYNFGYVERILQKYYDYFSWRIYEMYRSVPFLFEIRCILDWSFAHTSIQFHMYQKQEDIHA